MAKVILHVKSGINHPEFYLISRHSLLPKQIVRCNGKLLIVELTAIHFKTMLLRTYVKHTIRIG